MYVLYIHVVHTHRKRQGADLHLATSKFISRGHSGAYDPGGPLAHGLEVVYREDLFSLDLGAGSWL